MIKLINCKKMRSIYCYHIKGEKNWQQAAFRSEMVFVHFSYVFVVID